MDDESHAAVGRRRSLLAIASAVSAGVAGCASFGGRAAVGNSFATDVAVHSAASDPKTVSVTITETTAETAHTSETLDLDPGDTVDPVNDAKLPANGHSYVVDVDVTDGPSETFEWSDPSPDLAPLWVRIDDSENVRFLLQAG